jgi:hypothetical protein
LIPSPNHTLCHKTLQALDEKLEDLGTTVGHERHLLRLLVLLVLGGLSGGSASMTGTRTVGAVFLLELFLHCALCPPPAPPPPALSLFLTLPSDTNTHTHTHTRAVLPTLQPFLPGAAILTLHSATHHCRPFFLAPQSLPCTLPHTTADHSSRRRNPYLALCHTPLQTILPGSAILTLHSATHHCRPFFPVPHPVTAAGHHFGGGTWLGIRRLDLMVIVILQWCIAFVGTVLVLLRCSTR